MKLLPQHSKRLVRWNQIWFTHYLSLVFQLKIKRPQWIREKKWQMMQSHPPNHRTLPEKYQLPIIQKQQQLFPEYRQLQCISTTTTSKLKLMNKRRKLNLLLESQPKTSQEIKIWNNLLPQNQTPKPSLPTSIVITSSTNPFVTSLHPHSGRDYHQ